MNTAERVNSALDAISNFTGLAKPMMDKIWEEVKANQALLEACRGHDFSLPADQRGKLTLRWKCTRCGGLVDAQCKRWYETGLKHGMAKG